MTRDRKTGAWQALIQARNMAGGWSPVTTEPEVRAACKALGVLLSGDETADEGLWLVDLGRDDRARLDRDGDLDRKRSGFRITVDTP